MIPQSHLKILVNFIGQVSKCFPSSFSSSTSSSSSPFPSTSSLPHTPAPPVPLALPSHLFFYFWFKYAWSWGVCMHTRCFLNHSLLHILKQVLSLTLDHKHLWCPARSGVLDSDHPFPVLVSQVHFMCWLEIRIHAVNEFCSKHFTQTRFSPVLEKILVF